MEWIQGSLMVMVSIRLLIQTLQKGVLPPLFRGWSEEEVNHPWFKIPLKIEIENVNIKHIVLALKVKSILVPDQDKNNDIDLQIHMAMYTYTVTYLSYYNFNNTIQLSLWL
ncbi:hypothetical protein MKX03_015821 [Papaver bracteatum]|nr:hypothetical protein MKX03_015821 [Papaver bracteatum]